MMSTLSRAVSDTPDGPQDALASSENESHRLCCNYTEIATACSTIMMETLRRRGGSKRRSLQGRCSIPDETRRYCRHEARLVGWKRAEAMSPTAWSCGAATVALAAA